MVGKKVKFFVGIERTLSGGREGRIGEDVFLLLIIFRVVGEICCFCRGWIVEGRVTDVAFSFCAVSEGSSCFLWVGKKDAV